MFNQRLRTNNDVEGWLIMLLHRASRLLRLQVKLVREGKLERYQRKAEKSTQGALFKR